VLEEAGLDGPSQFAAVRRYIQAFARGDHGAKLALETA